MHVHVYFEAAGVIIAFILLGKMLEEKAKGNTSAAIKKLIGLQPKTVILVDENGNERHIAIDEVLEGDILLVKPGEKLLLMVLWLSVNPMWMRVCSVVSQYRY